MNLTPHSILQQIGKNKKYAYFMGFAAITLLLLLVTNLEGKHISDIKENPQTELNEKAEKSSEIFNHIYAVNSKDLPEYDTEKEANSTKAKSYKEATLKITDKKKIERTAGSTITLTFNDILVPDRTYSANLEGMEFSAAAFSWDEGSFDYRFTKGDEAATLKTIEIDTENHNPEKIFSELFILEDENKLYIRPEETLENLQLTLLDPKRSDELEVTGNFSATGHYNLDSGAKYTTLNMISRDTWGASYNPDIDDPDRLDCDPYYYHANRIVIHHTVTPNSPSDPAYYVRLIYLDHSNRYGCGDIGYNFLIDHKGNIYEGKLGGEEVKGYHVGQPNPGSIGIALLGDFTSISPTSSAQSSLIKLMAEKAAFHNFDLKYATRDLDKFLDTSYTVFGHRDTWCYGTTCYDGASDAWHPQYTACPGNTFHPQLNSITQQAQIYKNTHFGTIKRIASKAESELANHYSEMEEYPGYEVNKLYVIFDLPRNTDRNTILGYIPSYSSITDVSVYANTATISVEDWDNGGFLPPKGWEGWYTVPTYFPASGGTKDRIKTLYKIFSLYPDVEEVRYGGGENITRFDLIIPIEDGGFLSYTDKKTKFRSSLS